MMPRRTGGGPGATGERRVADAGRMAAGNTEAGGQWAAGGTTGTCIGTTNNMGQNHIWKIQLNLTNGFIIPTVRPKPWINKTPSWINKTSLGARGLLIDGGYTNTNTCATHLIHPQRWAGC